MKKKEKLPKKKPKMIKEPLAQEKKEMKLIGKLGKMHKKYK
jgi:hypothetical protein